MKTLGYIICFIGGGVIGYFGGWPAIGGEVILMSGLFIIDASMCPRRNWADKGGFFDDGIGRVQSRMGNNYPPGFDERDLD